MSSSAAVHRPAAIVVQRRQASSIAVALGGSVVAGVLHRHAAPAVAIFLISAAAIAALALVVGDAVDEVDTRMTAGAVGVMQSFFGNVPAFFIAYFALKDGLVDFVQATLIGSLVANQLLMLGLALAVGKPDRFSAQQARHIALFSTLGAIGVASIAFLGHGSAHRTPTLLGSGVLLLLFAASLPRSIRSEHLTSTTPGATGRDQQWPVWFAVSTLLACSAGAAFVSDWFVDAMTPAINSLHLSETFTGLVIVGVTGNAVGNACGVVLARRNKYDTAVSIILNSPLQILLLLLPVLLLATFSSSHGAVLTGMSTSLVVTLVVGTVAASMATVDGRADRLRGIVLVSIFALAAMVFW